MTKSMTAFARKQDQQDFALLTWEIRSVNNRYLDISFRLPETCRELEPKLREIAAKSLHRGKVECSLRYQPIETVNELHLNKLLATQLINTAINLQQKVPDGAHLNVIDIIRWPGVLQINEVQNSALPTTVLQLFGQTLAAINDSRSREGEKLKATVEQRLASIDSEITTGKSNYLIVSTGRLLKKEAPQVTFISFVQHLLDLPEPDSSRANTYGS